MAKNLRVISFILACLLGLSTLIACDFHCVGNNAFADTNVIFQSKLQLDAYYQVLAFGQNT